MLGACKGEHGGSPEPPPADTVRVTPASTQAPADAGVRRPIVLKAAHVIDAVAATAHDDYGVLVEGERISAVGPAAAILAAAPADKRVIDLGACPAIRYATSRSSSM